MPAQPSPKDSAGPQRRPKRSRTRGATLPQLLANAVELSSGSVAVTCAGRSLTYAELDERSSRLARVLIARGIGPEDLVAVTIARSIESVLAVWAITKTGAAFVPIDPEYPTERVEFIIADSGVKLGLTLTAHRGALPTDVEWLALDDPAAERTIADHDGDPITYQERVGALRLTNPAYVIYTSGSTGRPKGVMVTHAGLANFAAEQRERYSIDTGSRTLHFASPSFDASVLELLLATGAGATMVISPTDVFGGAELAQLLRAEQVTHAFITPAALASVDPTGLDTLDVVVVGGEACSAQLVDRWARTLRFHNGYGPTETTIMTNISDPLIPGEPITIGAAIRGMTALVLDSRLNQVPPGVTGELYLAGPGLARGYNRRPGLTGERFVANPNGEPGERMYRSGDLARWRTDNTVEYVGRADFQVKLRGYRIELGEIDAAMMAHPDVEFAVTLAREIQSGTTALVGYIVAVPGREVDVYQLAEFVGESVPAYMVPTTIMSLDRIPLTPVGKLDRGALPAPELLTREYRQPTTPTERVIASVFEAVLSVNRVGAGDDFFELGGNSLVATQAVARIGAEIGTRVPARLLFESSSVEDLAARLGALAVRARTPLVRREPTDRTPLSMAQQRMWLTNQFDVTSPIYNVPFAIRLTGNLDTDALRAAIGDVIERHEPLRTIYPDSDDGPYQEILAASAAVPRLDVERIDESALQNELLGVASSGFDLSKEVPLRGKLLQLGEHDVVLVLIFHHIACDGTSLAPLVRDVLTAYVARAASAPPAWAPLPVRYADFAVWQRELLGDESDQGSLSAEQIRYWVQQLTGLPEMLALPFDRPRPARPSGIGANVEFEIPVDILDGLHRIAREHNATLFMTVHAALAIVLARLSNSDDIAIGTQIAGRGEEALDDLVGMFGNTLALRTAVPLDDRFATVLDRVRDADLGAFSHSDLPFDRVVDVLRPNRSLAFSPLFQVLLMLQNFTPPQLASSELTIAPIEPDLVVAKLDLSVVVAEQILDDGTRAGASGTITYATELFDRATVERFAERLTGVVAAVVADQQVVVGDLPMMLESEERVVAALDARHADTDTDTLVDLVEAQVDRDPSAIALVSDDEALTYAEFDARTNRLARELISIGVGPETRVALSLRRSVDLIVAIYAVLKTGGAYVPLDPDHPAERTEYVLESSTPLVVLTADAEQPVVPATSRLLRIDTLELDGVSDARVTDDERTAPLHPDNAAYVIFTSGSTGRPKGVVVSHRCVVNQMAWMRGQYQLSSSDALLHKTPATFDASVWEIYLPLQIGARMVIARPDGHLDAEYLLHLLRTHGVAIVEFVPSMLALFLSDPALDLPDSLRYVSVGGEELPKALVERFQRAHTAVLDNTYGPTEATVTSTVYRCLPEHDGPIPIGVPVPNTGVYVLDSRLRRVPIGVPGELYLTGVQLARGYLGRTDLTAERFVADALAPDGGGRMYRTGDLVRIVESADPEATGGVLEFLGRTDFQVKLRGLRIELGEIEAALTRHGDVARAVVTVIGDGGPGDQLAAYVVLEPGATLDLAALTEHAEQWLPQYMVPNHVVELDHVPLNASGKLDRRSLPRIEIQQTAPSYRAPTTHAEETIAGIFGELLALDRVGADDSFFELGGNSLIGMRVIARANGALGSALGVRDLFEHPTTTALAARATSGAGDSSQRPPLVPQQRPARIPLSLAQQRMWFLNRFDPGSSVNNIPAVIRLTGDLDVPALRAAIGDVTGRHESLRTIYPDHDGTGYQSVVAASDAIPDVPVIDTAHTDIVDTVASLVTAGFDTTTTIPFRVALLRLDTHDHILVVVVHHIAADGFSIAPLTRDVMVAYSARSAGAEPVWTPLAVQYGDFAIWQRAVLGSEDDPTSIGTRQLAYWRTQLAGLPDQLDLPADRPRPQVASQRGAQLVFGIDENVRSGLEAVAKRQNSTLFMVVHAALAGLLARLSNTTDIVIGTPIAGRGERELDDVIGMFVNTLVLRTDVQPGDAFTDLVDKARTTDLGAFGNAEVPFERLVEVLNPARSTARSPLFQVMLTFQNFGRTALELPGLSISGVDFDVPTAKFDLGFLLSENVTETGAPAGMAGAITYATDLFDAATVQSFADRFTDLLSSVVADPQRAIGDVELLRDDERSTVLTAWNDSARTLDPAATVVSMFDAQVTRTPDAVAVVADSGESLTYREFDARVNRLARWLIGNGVGPESLVGLAIRRSTDLLIGMYAVAKSGGAYVPIDPDQPADRVAYVLEVANPVCVLTSSHAVDTGPWSGTLVDIGSLAVDGFDSTPITDSDRSAPLRPQHTAYVIFTSGSTGRPKGVAVAHQSLANGVSWRQGENPLGRDDAILQKTPFTFDASVREFWWPLLVGARLVVASPDGHRDPNYLVAAIARHRITAMHFVPAMLALFVPAARTGDIESLRLVLCGGEPLPPRLLGALQSITDAEVRNEYGPTEGTVTITRSGPLPAAAEAIIPIGGPVWNSRVYVLDSRLHAVPAGVPGELYIAGVQIARGYQGRPDLTAGRFVPNPFDSTGERMYRTGDLVRWGASGELEYIGRTDFQVKLRGLRIELGEIEASLTGQSAVAQAVAVVRTDSRTGDQLVAYLVGAPGIALDVDAVRTELGRKVPAYMVPTAFVILDALPLNASGKLDRKALPEPVFQSKTFRAPITPIEQTVADTFGEVLGVERVGLDDDFFDLGGNSLVAVRATQRLEDALGTNVALQWLFTDRTVAELAARLMEPASAVVADADSGLGVLIPLRTGGTAAPLFCVHPLFGLAWAYLGLAQYVDRDRPIYGLQSPAILERDFDYATFGELAARYVREIRKLQPSGPYHLLGWSLGGVIAHEIAVALQAAGETVEFLGLMDATPESDFDVFADELTSHMRSLGIELPDEGNLVEISLDRAEEILASYGDVPDMITAEHVQRMFAGAVRMIRLEDAHQTRIFDGDIAFFSAAVDNPEPEDAALKWQPYVSGQVVNFAIPTQHGTMLDPASLDVLGPYLDDRLKQI
ncbi:non-ribosomal peptide synthetase [Antrihabitans cavernicola]|uniref:non-ribosomal peptide synthetase n=1 Tax=Antrihabitans cavernicola TaxID=2495913 RepID=UPI0016598D85|nr:non-ribosomal peptide synthetase [Spelaeibacter cavernicola]